MPLPLTIGSNFPEHLQGGRPHPLDPPIDIYDETYGIIYGEIMGEFGALMEPF